MEQREQSNACINSAESRKNKSEAQMRHSGIEWIGEIPKEWKVTLSKRLFTIVAGATPKTDNVEMWDGDITWITPADYKTEDKYVMSGRRNLSEKGKKSCATYLLPCNTIVFSKRAPIGLVAITAKELCTNQGCLGCIPNGQLIVLFYYYAMSAFTEQFELLGTGTTFKEISATKFANFPLPFPPLSEQQKIANYLDKVCGEVDEMIALQEQMIEELKAYKQSVITEAVTKGLNPDVPMKDSGIDWIGEVPEHWKQSKTLYVLSMPITDGPHTTPDLFDEGIPFISADAVSDGYINFENKRGYISESFYEECCKKYIPQIDDIYMIKSGASTGRTAIVETDEIFTIWSPLAVFRANKRIMEPRYLLYVLRSEGYQKQVENNWSFGTQQNIGMRTLEKLIICYPPLSEQQATVSYLDTKCAEIDSLIAIKQAKIEELKEYKKSVIYEYVTGKKEVV